MKSQAILKQGAFSLVFEQAPEKKARIMLYVGKVYVTIFDITIEQLKDILICLESEQMKWIDQDSYDKEFMRKYGYVLTPLREAYKEEP